VHAVSPWRVALFYGYQHSVDCKRLEWFRMHVLADAASAEDCCNFVAGVGAIMLRMVPLPLHIPLYCGPSLALAKSFIHRWASKKFYYNRLQLLAVLINMVFSAEASQASTPE
jgi:hypothetical protein